VDTEAITILLKDVAAQVITPRFRSLQAGEVHEKQPGDLVTIADHEAEDLITAALQAAYPSALVIGEESVAQKPALLDAYAHAEHAFIIDPIDGTKNFVNGSPDHAVMAAELRHGLVVRSWIWQPQHEAAYVAERGAGAFRNGEPLTTTPPSDAPATWRGVTSRRGWVGRALPGLSSLELSWVSCGIDYPRLIEGAADYLVYYRTLPWDHAPGQLLLTEAGGELRTYAGEPYDPRHPHVGGLVAAADRATYDGVVAGWSATRTWR